MTNRPWTLDHEQRDILYSVIRRYWSVPHVRAVLAQNYPDIPSLSESTIRYHRLRIQKEIDAEDQAIIHQVSEQLISNKLARVKVLEANIRKWQNRPLTLASSREIRKGLKQVAREMDNLRSENTRTTEEAFKKVAVTDLQHMQQVRVLVTGLINKIAERQSAIG